MPTDNEPIRDRPGSTGLTKRPQDAAGEALCRELFTLRDWLRYAVSRFNAEELVYGHGTTTALDEAAYLLLWALHLPIDELDPWLDARLSRAERRVVFDLIEARISTRRPAPYLTGEAYIQGFRFRVDDRVIVPRSFIGELLADGMLPTLFPEIEDARLALDLCTGSGCLAIIMAAHCHQAEVDAADVCEDALRVARLNVADYDLGDRINIIRSDLYDRLPEGRRYDLVVSNPPYVRSAAVRDFPPEYGAEPVLAHDGGPDGLELVRRIIDGAAARLSEEGLLIVEVGSEREAIEAAYPELPLTWLDTELSQGEVFAIRQSSLPNRA